MIKRTLRFQGKTFLLLALFTIAVADIAWHWVDDQNRFMWWQLSIWIGVFTASFFLSLIVVPKKIWSQLAAVVSSDRHLLLFIVSLAFATRFLFIGNYPYVVVGDELRDAGLNGRKIAQGIITDVFDFGDYQGYGNFIPLISYYGSFLFGHTPLSYRIPAAILGILAIAVTYLLGRLAVGRSAGFAASAFLIANYAHLHYSRTELLVIMDSFLAVVILLTAWAALKIPKAVFCLGLILGFAFHFYAGIRGMVFIVASTVLIVYAFRTMKPLLENERIEVLFAVKKIAGFFILMFLLGSGMVIGVGPRLHTMVEENLLFKTGLSKNVFEKEEFRQKPFIEKALYMAGKSEQAFRVYLDVPTSSHFGYRAPLLTFPVNWFFAAGFFYLLASLVKKNHGLLKLTLFLIIAHTFTNQVFLDHVGADHRLMGVVPLLTILSGYGYNVIVKQLPKRVSPYVSFAGVAIILVALTGVFFGGRLSDRVFLGQVKEFVFQKALLYIQKRPAIETFVIAANEDEPLNFDTIQHKEKVEYFLPDERATIVTGEELAQRQIQQGQEEFFTVAFKQNDSLGELIATEITNCQKTGIFPRFDCPVDYTGEYAFYVYNNKPR